MIDAQNVPREERLYRVLWRPRLWLGCDIYLLVLGGMFALVFVPVALATRNAWWMLFGVGLLAALVPSLRWLARIEPQVIPVASRYRKYARHYVSIGSVGTPLPEPRKHQR